MIERFREWHLNPFRPTLVERCTGNRVDAAAGLAA
jgi:hypothetical protein